MWVNPTVVAFGMHLYIRGGPSKMLPLGLTGRVMFQWRWYFFYLSSSDEFRDFVFLIWQFFNITISGFFFFNYFLNWTLWRKYTRFKNETAKGWFNSYSSFSGLLRRNCILCEYIVVSVQMILPVLRLALVHGISFSRSLIRSDQW